jgi:hypothetical protein
MRYATFEHQGRTLVGLVDKAGEKVTPISVSDINALFRGERYRTASQRTRSRT